MTAAIGAVGTAFPPPVDQQESWDGFFSTHYGGSRAAARIWRNAGVRRRHAAVNPCTEDISGDGTAARMSRFVDEAMPLGKEAVEGCLARVGLDAGDVDLFTVVSCTGYATPGVDILLARDLGMPSSVQRLQIGHMGCYAALPGLAAVSDAAVARGKTGVLLCLELPSLHLQGPTAELDQIVAHALFSDAAAAVAVVPGGPGLEIVDVVAATEPATAGYMTWEVTDHGFRMRLSSRVPSVLDENVGALVDELLGGHDLRVADVDHWAIHPGGPRIISTIARRLGLPDEAVAASTSVLRDHGNCSSATVLLVLDELVRTREPTPGDHVVAMAFGPGLTLYAALLRAR